MIIITSFNLKHDSVVVFLDLIILIAIRVQTYLSPIISLVLRTGCCRIIIHLEFSFYPLHFIFEFIVVFGV